MKKIVINSDNRRFNISCIVVGYLEENKEEVLEFEIPEKYAEYGKKACFSANGQTFAKNFDDIISNKLTITRDISQFKELDMTIAFFKIENEDEIIARTSILHILIENAIVCDDDVKPDDPKIIILDNLIDEVTKLDVQVTKNEKKREEYYQEIQKKVDNGDFNGATFTPSVDVNGNISWTNDKNLSNPTTQNIKGPKGDKGDKGDTYTLTEQDKQDISSITVESSESAFNQYYNGKLEDFNSNATNKTTEFNNNAISKVNEFNTNADNKIAEYDLHSQELDNKIIDTRNELERVKNDVLETGTDTDTYIHLEDSAMAEYQELSVDGVCEQDTTTGKNLFDIKNTTKATITTNDNTNFTYIPTVKGDNDYLIDCDAKTSYTISMILSTTVGGDMYIYLLYTDNTVESAGSIIGSGTLSRNILKTSNAEKTLKGISVRSYNIATYNNYLLSKPMLEKGSTSTDYEPYTGGQPTPNPDHPQPISTIENSLKITSCNKNLLDTSIYSKGMIGGSGQDVADENIYRFDKYNIVKPNTKIYLLKKLCVYYYDKDKKFIEMDLSGSLALTTPSNCKYIRFRIFGVDFDTFNPNNYMVSYEQETSYEQHLETQITANLPEGEFIGKINDTYKDTLKVEYNEDDGQYHLNLYKRVYKNNSYNGESYNYYISTTARNDGIINCGELQTGQVVYYLGNETILDLGVVEQLISYDKITNLFTDSDLMPNINAKYYRNFISTVRNLQVNEKALKQELIDINARLSALETASANVVSESEVVE